MRPYRTTENIIDGAVITFSTINDQKRGQEQLQILYQAMEWTPHSMIITDAQGNIEYVDPHFVVNSGL